MHMAVSVRSSPDVPIGASTRAAVLTLTDVAEYLKISKKTVYRLVRSGDLPAFKAGKHWRVLHSELGKWIAQQSAQKGELAR